MNPRIGLLKWFSVVGLLLLAALLSASSAGAQVATDFYGQASLLPSGETGVQPPGSKPSEPSGSAQFYQVGDPAGSTRVEVEISGLAPGASATAGITEGGCQGAGLFTLNELVADKSGTAHSTTVLSGQQAAFGQWYVTVQLCDPLNPGQVCSLCGKVSAVIPLAGGSVPPQGGVAPGMPNTGNVDGPLPGWQVGIALAILVLFAGAWLKDGRSRLP